MIDIDTIEAIAPYVEHNNAKAIVAIPGSTLSVLTQRLIEKSKFMVSVVDNTQLRNDFTVDDAAALVHAASIDSEEYRETHQLALDEAVKHIGRIMRNNIFLARSTVLPMIDKYTDQITKVVSDKCSRSVLALNIIEDKKRNILANPQLRNIVSDQSNRTNYEDIKIPRMHNPEVSAPELVALMATGSSAFDVIIRAWIDSNQLDGAIKQVYNDLFIKSAKSGDLFGRYINVNDYQTTIIALLLCWGLTKNVQDGIEVSLSDYKDTMEVFSAACCGMISQAIRKYERGVKNKNLVLQYPVSNRQFCFDDPAKNCIVVDAETYAIFLEAGGCPEMIFGSYLTDRAITAEGIMSDAEKYIKEYNKQTARGRLTAINNTLTIVKAEMRNIAFDIVRDITETHGGDEGTLQRDVVIEFTGNKHLENANAFIKAINAKDIEDYYGLIRNFICSCYFEGSMVHQLLNKIDILDPQGDKDINEMALVATTDLIVDWLINQIETSPTEVSMEGFYNA